MPCEDYPCCGHELGCCPNYDEAGRQLDMVCTCGARLPITRQSSLCDTCLRSGDDREPDTEDLDGWGTDDYWDYRDDY